MNIMSKLIFTVSVIFTFAIQTNAKSENENNRCDFKHEFTVNKNVYEKEYIENTIMHILKGREQSKKCKNDISLGLEYENLIEIIFNSSNIKLEDKVIFYLKLIQNSDVSSHEYIMDVLNNFCYENTEVVITILSKLNLYLKAEFQTNAFYKSLYLQACAFPFSITQSKDFNPEKEIEKRIIVYKKIKNEDNKHIVEFLLKNTKSLI